MKLTVFLILLVCALTQCKKTYAPYDKKANINFINMEGGGLQPGSPAKPVAPIPSNPPTGSVQPSPSKPIVLTPNVPPNSAPTQKPTIGQIPSQVPQVPSKPAPVTTPTKPIQAPTVPSKGPSLSSSSYGIPPKAGVPVTTPGPGTVKQLVTFYDSQGKASVIRPYSYSQAVKQG